MKDYIGIIIVLIFIVGPLLKKIFEALAGGSETPRKRASVQEVKDYLEKMRSQSGQQSSGQRQQHRPATSSSPSYGQRKYDPRKPYGGRQQHGREERKPPKRQQSQRQISRQTQQSDVEAIVEKAFALEDSQRKLLVKASADPAEKAIPAIPVPQETEKASVLHRLMQEPRYNDAQKALIFSEIFKRPKALKEIFQK